jgi:dipeptidyl aminopeptidase/acylaminoacyl peptidase
VIAILALLLAQDLGTEVRDKGWIVYGAKTAKGDWDLFVMRPDGSESRNLTNTPDFNEGLPRWSPDGKRLLYRRLPKSESFDNNRHGLQGELVLANADGTEPRALGAAGELPWASWSPDGKKLACLSQKGVFFFDLESRKVTGSLDRKGFFQQLTWSPDGKWLSGVANNFDTGWSVARMEVATGAVNAVSKIDCCTPDWFPDSRRMVFSRRPGDWTQLWMADAEGRQRVPLYSEEGRHCYGGCISPDGKYVLFTGNKQEDGDPANAGAPMALMRLKDAPIVKPPGKPANGPVLVLPSGWEPHWKADK